jgi:hypothetical protein
MDNRGEPKKKILVILPAWNEEEKIASVIQQVKAEIPEAKILVINDGSTDQTEPKALAAGAKVLSHPFNMGYGVALQTGYKYALKYGFDNVLQMDADGQHDPRSLRTLLKIVEEGKADVAIGSRFLGEKKYRISFCRRIGMHLFGFIATFLSGQKITDPTSGYQALGPKAIKFFTREVFPGDYPDADVLVMLHRAGFRIQEVAVAMHPNLQGKSMHSGFKPIYYTYKVFLSIALNLVRKECLEK